MVGSQAKETLKNLDENCPTIKNFKLYSQQLDEKWDKFERLVKLSRNITIESKRIIFLLHTISREDKKISVLNEAEKRLNYLINNEFKAIAQELDNEDPYLYHRSFSPGIQEFIEAFLYYNYIKNNRIFNWPHYQKELEYKISDETSPNEKTLSTPLVPIDFILGLLDVTGELMRKCINNLGSGELEDCFKTCDLVKGLFSGFVGIDYFKFRTMSKKVFVLKQSLLKMEMVCYNIRVRGNEVPRHALTSIDDCRIYEEENE